MVNTFVQTSTYAMKLPSSLTDDYMPFVKKTKQDRICHQITRTPWKFRFQAGAKFMFFACAQQQVFDFECPLDLLLPSLDHGGCSACVEFDGWCQCESLLRWLLQDCKTETIFKEKEEEGGGRDGARGWWIRRQSSVARANLERARLGISTSMACKLFGDK